MNGFKQQSRYAITEDSDLSHSGDGDRSSLPRRTNWENNNEQYLYHGLNKHIQIDPSFDREAIEKHTEQKIFPFFSHLRYSKRSIAEQIHDHQ